MGICPAPQVCDSLPHTCQPEQRRAVNIARQKLEANAAALPLLPTIGGLRASSGRPRKSHVSRAALSCRRLRCTFIIGARDISGLSFRNGASGFRPNKASQRRTLSALRFVSAIFYALRATCQNILCDQGHTPPPQIFDTVTPLDRGALP